MFVIASFDVSTHSRPKAAGQIQTCWIPQLQFQHTAARRRLERRGYDPNTGVWFQHTAARRRLGSTKSATKRPTEVWFQHTAARRRLAACGWLIYFPFGVSTHSRPKAAGTQHELGIYRTAVSTHSRPKAAGSPQNLMYDGYEVSTHSRPKAAGSKTRQRLVCWVCFNTQPPEGGWHDP